MKFKTKAFSVIGYVGTLCVMSALHNWSGLVAAILTPIFFIAGQDEK